jgi:hypothetical protein
VEEAACLPAAALPRPAQHTHRVPSVVSSPVAPVHTGKQYGGRATYSFRLPRFTQFACLCRLARRMPLFLKQSALLARWVTRKGLTVPLGKHGNKQFNKGKGVPSTGRLTKFGACACAR